MAEIIWIAASGRKIADVDGVRRNGMAGFSAGAQIACNHSGPRRHHGVTQMSSDAFAVGQRLLLERIASGEPLAELLTGVVSLIEKQAVGMFCSILLVDAERQTVHPIAAPGLPAEFTRALDGARIGPRAGSCGAAAFRATRVIVEDIETHPYWADYKHLALPHGLRACWSTPIVAPNREVLGTFAMYYKTSRAPAPVELTWVDAATHLAAIAILRDRNEQSLRQSEERLRAVVEHTPNVAIQWFDEAGRILFANETSHRLFGWNRGTTLGKTLDELGFGAAGSALFSKVLGEVVTTGSPVGPVEFTFRRADGRDGVLLSTVFPIPFAATRLCYACMDVDLTDRREAEEKARSEEQLRALVYSTVTDVVFYLGVEPNAHFRFLSVNPAFLRATGLPEDAVVGRTVNDVIPEPSRSLVLGKYREAIEHRGPISWEEVTQYPGGVRYGEVTVVPVFDESGRCTNLVGTVHDMTARRIGEEERRRLELQLHQAQRLQSLGTLAGGIAHDFNNILTAIRGHTDLALLEEPPNESVRESLTEISKASRRATDLVRQILTFSRHDHSQRETVFLRALIEEVLTLLRATLPRSIEITTHFASDTPPIAADATQLHQVIMNLGTNAAHAMSGAGGRLEIVTERFVVDAADVSVPDLTEPLYARVRISDQGHGMDADTMSRVFEPFFTTKVAGEGTGLGLSVVHGIMKNHNGAITVESTPGVGTTFGLYFPAAERAAPAPRVSLEGVAIGAGEHVMYVDDDEALVLLSSRMLRRLGYRVTAHTDAERALQEFRARSQEFDAVVTDMGMPRLGGVGLAQEVRRVRPNIRLVLVSSHVRPEDSEASARAGLGEVVVKPHSIAEFAEVLDRLLRGARPG